MNSPWSGSPIVPLSQDCLFHGVQSHAVLPEPVSLTLNESPPALVGTFFLALGKGPRTLIFPHIPSLPSV